MQKFKSYSILTNKMPVSMKIFNIVQYSPLFTFIYARKLNVFLS